MHGQQGIWPGSVQRDEEKSENEKMDYENQRSADGSDGAFGMWKVAGCRRNR